MEVDEWKKAEKRNLTSTFVREAYEMLRWECFRTRKAMGHVITELILAHLEDPPPGIES